MSPIAVACFGRSAAIAMLAAYFIGCNSTTTPSATALATASAPQATPVSPTATSSPTRTLEPAPTPEPTYPTQPSITAPWTAFPSLLEARANHTATVLPDGRILVVGGEVTNWYAANEPTYRSLSSVEIYRPATGRWERGRDLHDAREDHHAVSLPDGRVLVFGGRFDTKGSAWKYVTSAELFDPTTEMWTRIEGPPTNDIITRKPVVLGDGSLFMIGVFGTYPDHRARPVLFDPATSTWRRGARAPEIRIFAATTLLADGSILMVGGAYDIPDGGPSPSSTVLRYDPAKDAWSEMAPAPIETFAWQAFSLPDGDVLVIGGGAPMRYRPTSHTWTVLAQPMAYPDGEGMLRLSDGRILVAGSHGCFDGSELTAIYDPVTGTWVSAGSVAPGNGDTLVLLADGRAAMVGGYWECQAYDTHGLFGNVSVLDPSTVH